MRYSREQEAINRLEKIKLAIEKGYTANIETGEVLGVRGVVISSKTEKGYIRIGFYHNGKQVNIQAHQFIYYLATGIVDYGEGFSLDHNNRVKTDNRISNLSIESDANQQRNTDSYDEAKGCTWVNSLQKWRVRMTINGKRIHLGYFVEYDDARQTYIAAKEKYHNIN